MQNAIETFEHRGLTITIYPDPDPESPREMDNLGTMACWHRRYELGDEQPSCDAETYLEGLIDADKQERLEARREREYDRATTEEGRKQAYIDYRDRIMAEVEKQYIILPLYLYDHSGITMRTGPFSCPWDSGQVGWITVSLDKVRKEYSVKRITKAIRAKATECLESEVKCYATYLEGGYTGYEVTGADGDFIDSCWGFDDIEYCRQEAKDAADYEADKREKEARDEELAIEAESRAQSLG